MLNNDDARLPELFHPFPGEIHPNDTQQDDKNEKCPEKDHNRCGDGWEGFSFTTMVRRCPASPGLTEISHLTLEECPAGCALTTSVATLLVLPAKLTYFAVRIVGAALDHDDPAWYDKVQPRARPSLFQQLGT